MITFSRDNRSAVDSASDLLTAFGYRDMLVKGELRQEYRIRNSNGATTRFRQYYHDISVVGGTAAVRLTPDGHPRSLSVSIAEWKEDRKPSYRITASRAIQIAAEHISLASLRAPTRVEKAVLPLDGLPVFCWRVQIPAAKPLGDWEILINAASGQVSKIEDRLCYLRGSGLVFDPDPITATEDSTLQDDNDAADAVPEEAYSEVALADIAQDNDENYILTGPWVDTSPTEERARMDDTVFHFDREDDRFEEVMAYYHLDRQARYLRSIGYEDLPPSPQRINVNGIDDDYSFFSPYTGIITTGSGGVDDAEDADILLHEYGHALIQRVLEDWRGGDTELLAEGLCDYLAGDWSLHYSPDFQPYHLFNWDGHNEFWDGRILNSDYTYPEVADREPHDAGQLWSSLLTEIRQASGRRDLWNQVVIDHLYSLADSITVPEAAAALLESDLTIANGEFRRLIVEACERREILPSGLYSPRISHIPLRDTENIYSSRVVSAVIRSEFQLDQDRLWLIYAVDDDETDSLLLELSDLQRDRYGARLPSPHREADVSYYISVADTSGVFSADPAGAPLERHTFHVGPDRIPPVIVAVDSLPNSVFPEGEIVVSARVTDNIAVEEVSLFWYYGRMEPGGFVSLERTEYDPSLFVGRFRWSVVEPEYIRYMIAAVDASAAGNTASSRLRTFSILSEVLIDGFESSNRRWVPDGWRRSNRQSAEGAWSLYDRSDYDGWIIPREVTAELDEQWDFTNFDRARLVFWETHCFDYRAGEYGALEIREVDGDDWQEVERFTGWQDWWHQRIIDLSEYCLGRTAPIRIRFLSETPDGSGYTPGWRIDEIELFVGNWVEAKDSEELPVKALTLFDPYPNPFNDRLIISYDIKHSGNMFLGVYDIEGRLVGTLENKFVIKGSHRLTWDSPATGIYFVVLDMGGEKMVKKVICVK